MRAEIVDISKNDSWFPYRSVIIGMTGEISDVDDWGDGWNAFTFIMDDEADRRTLSEAVGLITLRDGMLLFFEAKYSDVNEGV